MPVPALISRHACGILFCLCKSAWAHACTPGPCHASTHMYVIQHSTPPVTPACHKCMHAHARAVYQAHAFMSSTPCMNVRPCHCCELCSSTPCASACTGCQHQHACLTSHFCNPVTPQVTLAVTPVDAFEEGIQVSNSCPLVALPANQVREFSLG